MRNRYLISLDGRPSEWRPDIPGDLPMPDCAYLGEVFRSFEQASALHGLTFVVTKDPSRVPVTGPEVIAVLVADEWARAPVYLDQVGALLKTMGKRFGLPFRALWPPSAVSAAAALNWARVMAERTLWSVREKGLGGTLRRPDLDKVIEIPLGYHRQRPVPWKRWEERGRDLFFAGSLAHDLERRTGWKRWARSRGLAPKTLHRRRMVEAAESVRRRRPDLNVELRFTGDFHGLSDEEGQSYSAALMDTKLCLAPQGSSLESYRLFEGLRFGCIVICEEQPRRWYYADAPFVRLHDWGELPAVVDLLMADEAEQQRLHRASLDWWHEVCAGEPVGRRLATELEAVLNRTRNARGGGEEPSRQRLEVPA